jgi:hypothetical protein
MRVALMVRNCRTGASSDRDTELYPLSAEGSSCDGSSTFAD